mmetsp:Transcript_9643/g.16683  ORF Transcript_9643/g.16683 Transcript_9643/m.16683 type:complete len:581 (-) Transcript_9643:172-1914(-)
MIAEELTCPVCVDTFVNPVILKCSHNLCLTCAEQVYSFRKLQSLQRIEPQKSSQVNERATSSSSSSADVAASIKCPVCSALTPLNPEKGIKDLTENLVLRNVLQEIASGSRQCGCCSKSLAVKDCIECKASFCSDCLDSWHTGAAFRGHQTTAMGTCKMKKSKTCGKHGEEMKIFCMDDQVLICSHCALFSAHKNHTCLPLSEAAESMKKSSEDLVWSVEREQSQLINVQEMSSSLSRQVQEDTTKVLDEVERNLNCLIGVLESRRDALVKMLKSDMKEKEEIFALQGITVSHLLSQADKLRKAEQDAAADPECYLSWTDDIKRFLKSAKEASSFWKFPKAPLFTMDLDENKKLLEALGMLTFPVPDELPQRPPREDFVAPPPKREAQAHPGAPSNRRSFLNEAEKQQLVQWMELGSPSPPLQLVFQAANDGFTFANFRAQYQKGKPSVCVVSLKNGFIFGGYTSVGWNVSDPVCFTKDPKAFLFRLSRYTRKLTRFKLLEGHTDLATWSGRGYHSSDAHVVAWGQNCDLAVCFDQASLALSCSNLGESYKLPDGADPRTFLAGSYSNWSFEDIEVYQVL